MSGQSSLVSENYNFQLRKDRGLFRPEALPGQNKQQSPAQGPWRLTNFGIRRYLSAKQGRLGNRFWMDGRAERM
tara:strand:+ start:19429 stop:19650 length:222 start_codon:yes stop_codon:yes gene_type:complete